MCVVRMYDGKVRLIVNSWIESNRCIKCNQHFLFEITELQLKVRGDSPVG